jgi:CheY-like chemotaxis protein
MNLAVNARDAMPTGGALTIETCEVTLTREYAERHQPATPGTFVMIAVSDTGVGMTEEVRSRIFEPFFTTKEQGKGTGLGLATVYGIVKQSGGFVWAYSEPGKGSSFKVYLPLVDEVAETAAPVAKDRREFTGTETILVTEDNELLRPMMRSILERYQYRVLDAPNAEEAARISLEHDGPIHLLLTDMIMPGISGRGLALQLAAKRPDMRVLFMSGYTDEAIIRNGQLERGSAFLQKPFTPEILLRKVREMLDA